MKDGQGKQQNGTPASTSNTRHTDKWEDPKAGGVRPMPTRAASAARCPESEPGAVGAETLVFVIFANVCRQNCNGAIRPSCSFCSIGLNPVRVFFFCNNLVNAKILCHFPSLKPRSGHLLMDTSIAVPSRTIPSNSGQRSRAFWMFATACCVSSKTWCDKTGDDLTWHD